MDYLENLILQIYLQFRALGLTDFEPTLLLAIGVSLVALYYSLRASRINQERLNELSVANQELRDHLSSLQSSLRDAVISQGARAQKEVIHPKVLAEEISTTQLEARKVPEVEVSEPSDLQGATVESGLKKTRGRFFGGLAKLFTASSSINKEALEQLEELLITSDLGVQTSKKLLDGVREKINGAEITEDSLKKTLKVSIQNILEDAAAPEIKPMKRDGLPLIILVVGVNGVGKTTTIGKLSKQFRDQGAKVILAACDTFRAAAVDQLEVWGKRVDVEVVTGEPNAKPSTIAYKAVHRARDEDYDVLIVDTAGRLHTRVNLMNELSNVMQIISREQPGSPHESILVLDASTGQNALQQAREFNDKVGLSGIVVTKLDGTPKGGIVVGVKEELGIPIRYIGVGEGVEDLKVFSAKEFVAALFAEDDLGQHTEDSSSSEEPTIESEQPTAAKKSQVKRKRRRAHE